MSAIPLSSLATGGSWQQSFLAVMPAILTHARIRFRRMPWHRREDAIAEAIACACVNYQRLAAQGRLHRAYVSSLSGFSARHVAQDRHVGGSQNARDLLSPLAQRKHGFTLQSLNSAHDCRGWRSLVGEDRHYSPADVAAFRIDFGQWMRTHTHRHRRIIGRLASGDGTYAVADRFGLSPARVSQLRRKYEHSWHIFQGEGIGQA
jgi:hypothetical protein